VLLVIGLQLIPLIIGSTLYSLVIGNAIAVTLVEKLFWLVIFIALACLSLYFLSSSILAVYIVTLPEMPPLKALRSARELVKGRRLQVIRKVLWLPILLLLASSLIMLPIILWLTALAQVVFFILSMLVLIVVHTYMYSLYRELLHE
jgi:sterol desaturase/sphingolipid hydroxylase (fatty acid hydroxylase superfamily)